LPVCPELTRDTIPRSRDVGHFLSVTGTVIRTSITKVLEYERDYMCAKCRQIFTMHADFDQFYTFAPPATCPNLEGCNSFKFTCLSQESEPSACRDFQEIKIQEQRWKPLYSDSTCDVELVLQANNIEVNNQQTTATLLMEDIQKEFKDFWESHRNDPIAAIVVAM
ncbi:hypothetical protein CRUP_035394, partial [Coryphaenoides rupestris]